MATNVEVERTGMENNIALLRRFTKKVQGSGVLPRIRSIRYKTRNQSFFKVKRATLEKLRRKAHVEEQIKLGKMLPGRPKRK